MTTPTFTNANWTLADIASQAGKNFIVTGANSGIGYQAALELAKKGAHVVLACRDRLRGQAAIEALHQAVPNAEIALGDLNLASLTSIKRFSETVLGQGRPLHGLINNAGVMTPPKRLETEEGFELQFGTNVLGHFALTAQLMPALLQAEAKAASQVGDATGDVRIVTVASIAHKRGRIDFNDLQSKRNYSPMAAYAQSKLGDLIFALELDRRLRAAGSRILSVAVHPGVASTNLFRAGDYNPLEKAVRDAMGPLIALLLNTDAEGALPTLYAATASSVEGGGYYGPQGFLEARGKYVGKAKIAAEGLNLSVATRLWSTCEDLTGVKFPLKV